MKHLANGYTQTWVKGKGYQYTHILTMEKKLGRKLRPDEEVNHKDGNKGNNTPGNLQLVVRGKSRDGIPSHAAVDPALKHGGRPEGS